MKSPLILVICFLIISFATIKINANDLYLDIKTLNSLKSFGVNIENMNLIELDPEEIKSNFNDFCKEDIAYQKKYLFIWSTFNRGYLDKLNIIPQSSSTLKGYPVTNLLDNKIETSWVEGAKGDGIGEWISLNIHTEKKGSPSIITLFGMIPGYLKSDQLWEENNRVKTALLVIKTISNGDYNIPDEYAVIRLKFKAIKGLQIFNVGEYQNHFTFNKKVWVIIEDVYKGIKYSDTCISEIYISGGCTPPSP